MLCSTYQLMDASNDIHQISSDLSIYQCMPHIGIVFSTVQFMYSIVYACRLLARSVRKEK